MYVVNLSEGSVVLPSGHELVTWLEVLDSELPALKRYEGTLLKFSKTKPGEVEKEAAGFPVEDVLVQQGGTETLAEALKLVKEKNEAKEEPEQEVVDDKAPAPEATTKKKK